MSEADELQAQIDEFRKEIRSESYPMSIGEMMSLYEDKEIDLHPEFQRFFRWTETQKSRLIESILLGIPLPAIFLVQRDDGVLDVVDGLQRLSTIFQFAQILRDENDKAVVPPLTLQSTKYLPALENVRWDTDDPEFVPLSTSQRLQFKRGKLNLIILERLTDPDAKYELFQRLNTGGSELSDQEVRNCILLMVDRQFYVWMSELCSTKSFRDSITLSERKDQERYDLELIVRFIVMDQVARIKEGLSGLKDLGDFLTDRIVDIARDEDYNRADTAERFKDVMGVISQALGDEAFLPYKGDKGKFTGAFSVAAFEAITFGVSQNLSSWLALQGDDRANHLRRMVIEMWVNDAEWRSQTGTGVRAENRLPFVISYAPKHFKPPA